jgi:hypothetical protein
MGDVRPVRPAARNAQAGAAVRDARRPSVRERRHHIGHALNKILKDLVIKSRSMAGMNAPYVPGWDCHGLPIELNVEKDKNAPDKDRAPAEFRRACRAFAEKFVDSQREDFKRLGILGDWADPYLTMKPAYQAAIVRALGQFVTRGLVYKGKKPVYWCLRDRTALAEAEVEYDTHKSPSIYVEFPLSDATTARSPAGCRRSRAAPVTVLIWTTTPWTIPSNLGIAFHPDFDYGAFEAGDHVVILAEALAGRVAEATGRALGAKIASFKAPPWSRSSSGIRSTSAIRLGCWLSTSRSTRARAPSIRAGPWRRRLHVGHEVRARDLRADRPQRTVQRRRGRGGRPEGVRGQSGGRSGPAGTRAAVVPHGFRALVSALLALSPARDLPGHTAVVHQHGRPARERRWRKPARSSGSRNGDASG